MKRDTHGARFLLAATLAAIACTPPAAAATAAAATQPPLEARATLQVDAPGVRIAPEIEGQFAEHLGAGIYGGLWVGEDSPIPNTRGLRNDVVAALRRLHVPVLRWPGGCFADQYHWRDGIGPRGQRPVTVNSNWGGVDEGNAFGTHEYYELLQQLGAKSYINGNVGTGSPREFSEWIDYVGSASHSTIADQRRANGRDAPWPVDYVAVGNETWGCGGNMRAEFYADVYRQYASFVHDAQGRKPVRIAVGPAEDDYHWTEVLMSQAAPMMDALSLHYYTIPGGSWAHKGSATRFGEDEWARALAQTLRMDELITRHSQIMDRYDPKRRVALFVDEWGLWHDAEPGDNPAFLVQQNTLRDALAAALNLDLFIAHAERVRMANIAQMVNVLQAMVLTDGPRMLLTPTYHVFDLYQAFQGARRLPLQIDSPDYVHGEVRLPGLHGAAGLATDGAVHAAFVNLDPNRGVRLRLALRGGRADGARAILLTAPAINSHNRFGEPPVVEPRPCDCVTASPDGLVLLLPPHALVRLDLPATAAGRAAVAAAAAEAPAPVSEH